MDKSKSYWLIIALVFLLIAFGACASLMHEKPLKAVDYSETYVSQSDSNEPININTSTKNELCKLDGIDKGKAKAIIEYRKEHGDFISIDEILDVDGIGTKTYIKIKDKICC